MVNSIGNEDRGVSGPGGEVDQEFRITKLWEFEHTERCAFETKGRECFLSSLIRASN